MRFRFLLLLVAVAIIGGALLVVLARNSSSAPAQETTPAVTANQPIPPPLRPAFPDELLLPDNPCHSLDIAEEVQQKKRQLRDQIAEAQTRADEVRAKTPLPFEFERGDPERRAVALTIDTGTGGGEGIAQLLAIAAHYRIPLTFFLTGCWIVENPEMAQEILRGGHSLGNHTLTHRNLREVDDAEGEREIAETDRIFQEALGVTPALFRKPQYGGGERVTELAGRFGKVSVLGYPDLGDTTGWRSGATPEDIATFVTRKTVPGAIWVMHNLTLADLGAFEDIVRFHLEEGYELVRVEDMLFDVADVSR